MKRPILILSLIAVFFSGKGQADVYGFSLDSISGNSTINLSAYAGKKILIVNTAAYDSSAWQYPALSKLQSLLGDSLVIIAVPSNSFGNETTDSAFFYRFYSQQPDSKFVVAKKIIVTGANTHPLYAWLSHQGANGFVDQPVNGPYQKFLIGKTGKLIAVFSRTSSPIAASVVSGIRQAR